jgi:cytochrome c peroxidase
MTKRIGAFIAIAAMLLLGAGTAVIGQASLTKQEQLGKQLFFDNISSPARSQSCASCHAPGAGWTGGVAGNNVHGSVYRGAERTRFGNRKPPASSYATFSPVFHYDADSEAFVGGNFWDGRATGERLGNPAADQALGPFRNPVEQNMPSETAVCTHVAGSSYAGLFEQVWGAGSLDCSPAGVVTTYGRIGLSIAAYEGSSEVSPFNSRFDSYWRACLAAGNSAEACGLADGDQADLDPNGVFTEQEFEGLIEFGEYCSPCHTSTEPGPGGVPPLFTDFTFDNVGTPRNPDNPFYGMDDVYLDSGDPINPLGVDWIDHGLGDFLRTRPAWAAMAVMHDGKHKVPTIRNVDKRPGPGFTKAYLHNGVFKSLKQVVHFYNTRDVASEGWAPPEVDINVNHELLNGKPLGDLRLTDAEEDAIVAFMKTLSDRTP